MGIDGAASQTCRAVQVPDITLQFAAKCSRRFTIRIQIEVLDFLSHNPVGHGVDVTADNVATDPVCLHERCSAPHERVGDTKPFEIVTLIEGFLESGSSAGSAFPAERARPQMEYRKVVLSLYFTSRRKLAVSGSGSKLTIRANVIMIGNILAVDKQKCSRLMLVRHLQNPSWYPLEAGNHEGFCKGKWRMLCACGFLAA